jgi:tRNA pseudouridine38-40 synthase
MPTTRLLLEYDGTDFCGWQTQASGASVQSVLEVALQTALREPVAVVGSGRTDAGVHARGQVAHFITEQSVDAHRLRASLNGLLPPSVAVLRVDAAPDGFHARYHAMRRTYHYQIALAPRALDRASRVVLPPPLDVEAMNEASRALLGTHEFSTFCRTKSETMNRVCTVERAEWVAEPRDDDWRFEIAADRFLHGMVRAIVGTLFEIGRGRRRVDALPTLIAASDRRAAGPAAPAHGLALVRVDYPALVIAARDPS